MKIAFIRGAYLNNFEGQNYNLPLRGYSSLFPIDDAVPFPLTKLPSIADLQIISILNKPIKYISNRTLGDSQILFGLEKNIQDADIVHVADPHYYYSFQAARMKERGAIRKLVSTWWETIPFNNESTFSKKRIKKYTMNQVDMFLCYTDRAKECLFKEGISQEKITVVHLGVNLQKFFPNNITKSKNITILFVGRLIEEKGVLDVYSAFKSISRFVPNVQLHIVGRGPLEKTLKISIIKDGLDNRVKIENSTYKEMPSAYQQADIFCVPSKKTNTWEEQYGMAFVEAMASGIPIVSYDSGAIKDMVGEAGLLVEEGNVQKLIDSLKRLIDDKELWHKIGTMGRVRAEKYFDAKITKEKIVELYKLVASS